MIRSDGSGSRKLTQDAGDRSPAWSPDGASLAFERAGRLFTIRPNGTGLKPLEPVGAQRDSDPTWSPDGRSIAFVRGGRSLMVMRVTGVGARRIYSVPGGGSVQGPSWSPNGKWIAFGLVPGACDSGSIAMIRPDGSGMRTMTARCGDPALNDSLDPGSGADDSDPAWSPDGTRIVFTRVVYLCGNCDQEETFMMNADGSHVRWVTTDTSLGCAYPAWSPDGKRLVADVGGVAILNLAGKTLRILDALGAEPAWQPGY